MTRSETSGDFDAKTWMRRLSLSLSVSFLASTATILLFDLLYSPVHYRVLLRASAGFAGYMLKLCGLGPLAHLAG